VKPEIDSFLKSAAKHFCDKPMPQYFDPKSVLIYRPHPVKFSFREICNIFSQDQALYLFIYLNFKFFLKVWWFDATLFVHLYFYRLRHKFITYKPQSLRPTPLSSLLLLRRGISIGLPGIEPAVQQAYALLFELRRTQIFKNCDNMEIFLYSIEYRKG
jgi:hypothetical protein